MAARPTELPPPGSEDALYLIDLSGYVFRAYHAIAPLTGPTGEPTQASYGTTTMLAKLVEERKPHYLGVAMDTKGPTFRDALDARYKAHRPPPPADLKRQMERSKQIVEGYRIPIFSKEGFEADDLIASVVKLAKARGMTVVIVSSDKDLMQIVDDKTMLWDTMKDRVFGPAEVEAKWGVPPNKLRDLLALVGDSSDNVPGVPSVGQKTAATLLADHGSLDGVYQNLENITKKKVKEMLTTHEDDARLSQKLVTLDESVELDFDVEGLRYGGADYDTLREIFVEVGFTRFVKEMPNAKKPVDTDYDTVLDQAALDGWVDAIKKAKQVAVEVFGTSREPMRADIVGIALCCDVHRAAYVPVGHRVLGGPSQLKLKDVLATLAPVLTDPTIKKIGHDLKFSDVLLGQQGIALDGHAFDTMLASYLLDSESSHELSMASERDVGMAIPAYESIAPKARGKRQAPLDEVEVDRALPYVAAHPAAVVRLTELYRTRMKGSKLSDLLSDIEMPLSRQLATMETIGVQVDADRLRKLGESMTEEMADLEKRARDSVGMPDLNVGSPKQLETVLYDELGLKATKRTKTGRSTDADALEAIAKDHALPQLILDYRALSKLKSTYIDALPRLIHPKTGRIHTRWSQAVAATGRLSSQDPNLQNIPIRTSLGRQIREAFVAPKGSVFLSADYSQIELRVLAHLSQDPVLLEAFNKGQDIHVRTAMEVFGVDEAGVTDDMRRKSKTINFGVIYGMGEVALSKQLGIPRKEASSFIEAYFDRYAGVREFMDRTMEEARRNERVETLLGRQRILPDLRASDRVRRAYAERIAQNTPIQGTAADLMKLAMVKLSEPVVPGARMVLTVHDELDFEVPEGAADEAMAKIKKAMEQVYELDVPLVVDAGYGPTWAEAH